MSTCCVPTLCGEVPHAADNGSRIKEYHGRRAAERKHGQEPEWHGHKALRCRPDHEVPNEMH